MDVKQCPHCFGRVMVLSDGLCPACRCDTRMPNASGRLRHRICLDDVVPQVCVVCGEATRRSVVVADQRAEEAAFEPDSGLKTIVGLVLGGWLGTLISLLSKRRTGSHVVSEMQLALCQCRHCRKAELRCLDANHQARTITIAAHERFIEMHEAANQV